ncbi:ABC transporter permease subunit [Kitasatospora sp. MBT63]|uniref:ABC transporter permease subunit n=1 Tax=Kitasatospora sp. MBT63 TaxID=1444768 RepID=UPI00053B4543|nr:ABC transporter permease subunit [Kitasatospora sp. MBT63]
MTALSTSGRDAVPSPGAMRGRGGVFGRALAYEWVALRSLRTPWLLCGSALAAQVLVDVAVGRDGVSGVRQFAAGMTGVTLVGFALLAALGVTVLGGEYRHRTITRTVLTLPDRRGILLAKAALTGAVAASVAAVMVVVNALSVPLLGKASLPVDRAVELGGAAVVYAVSGALVGLALAGVTRNSTLSIAVVILWPVLLENLVVLTTGVSQDLVPFGAAAAQVQATGGAGPQWLLMLPLVALTTVLLTAAGVLFARRDV